MISIVPGIIIGILLALPPGPASITAIKLGLSNSYRHGLFSALGIAIMDFLYCIIAVFAISAVLDWASNFSISHPFITLGVQLVIVLMIIVFGIFHLKTPSNSIEKNIRKSQNFIENLYAKGPFFIGVGIAIANIANPTFLPSLGYVALNIQKMGLVEEGIVGSIFFSVGFGLGTFLWLMAIIKIFVHYKKRMSERFLLNFQKFTGLTLIGFGTFLGYRLLEVTKLSELVRFIFAF